MTVARVLVTGMSGVGKSTALSHLERLGYRVVDTDWPGWAEEVAADGGRTEQLWLEEPMTALLSEPMDQHLFVSGCVANQVSFYDRFDSIFLLTAPLDVMLERIDARADNLFGKSSDDRRRIVDDVTVVEPLLRTGASHVIDATRSVDDVVGALVGIAESSRGAV